MSFVEIILAKLGKTTYVLSSPTRSHTNYILYANNVILILPLVFYYY